MAKKKRSTVDPHAALVEGSTWTDGGKKLNPNASATTPRKSRPTLRSLTGDDTAPDTEYQTPKGKYSIYDDKKTRIKHRNDKTAIAERALAALTSGQYTPKDDFFTGSNDPSQILKTQRSDVVQDLVPQYMGDVRQEKSLSDDLGVYDQDSYPSTLEMSQDDRDKADLLNALRKRLGMGPIDL